MIYILPFIVVLVITPLIRKTALNMNCIDKADGDALKIHGKPVALLGGAVIVIAYIIGLWLLVYSPQPTLRLYSGQAVTSYLKLISISMGGLLVFGVGLWDDLKRVKPSLRLMMQILAGIIILLTGIKVNFIPITCIAIPLTLFYIVGAINAFNVIDGMDGLCAGVSLVSCAGFFFLGLQTGNMFLVSLSVILFMSLLGFLPYNFYPARMFLGDAGSGFLGFMLGTMAVMATSAPYKVINFIVPILIIGVPVFDMALAIIRRLIRKNPLFIGDRDHIYDLLLKKIWNQPVVWGVMCGVQAVMVGIALFIHR